ncbi:MAG: amino acid ABC transporter substrate-binding protein [Alphaproteobacteria bacterium]|nr:amino acid ABC transporter substrate-binding protein [Alphaproteobacteria bacterium]MBV8548721.1 amino acid ABC transporter substrate-binding protein [Alphaproteobacteria bacterium]
MPNFLRMLLTGRDNFSWDIARVLMFLGGLVFLGCTLVSVLKTLQFDMDKFGYGFGALLGGGGAGIGAKAHAEPDAAPSPYITPPDDGEGGKP